MKNNGNGSSMRLDAPTSAFYAQQLQYISPKAFDVKRTPLLSRQLIPTIDGVPDFAEVFKFRGHESFGKAKLGSSKANAPSRSDVLAREATQLIVSRFDSFAYDYEEIRAAQATGMPLSAMKMAASVRSVEEQIDLDLSLGDAALGIKGILRAGSGSSALTGVTSISACTKTGGGTSWSPAAVNPEEIARDVMGLVDAIAAATEDDTTKFRIVLPRTKMQVLRARRMGDGAGIISILQYLLETHEQIESIQPWSRCLLAGATSNATRMAAFPTNADLVGALVPREPTLGAMVQGLMETEQVVTARCGGVVPFYPLYIGYCDAI